MTGIAFDWTVQLSDIMLVAGGIWAFFKMFLMTRDGLRDLTTSVGRKDPPSGIIGDLEEVKAQQRQHRDWFMSMFGRRAYDQHHSVEEVRQIPPAP